MPDLGAWAGHREGEITGNSSDASALLKCTCGKRGWHTKNISYIGARNLYSFKGGCKWMQEHQTCEPECSCDISQLSVDEELMEHIRSCPECKAFGF